jgi:hypothetical protein
MARKESVKMNVNKNVSDVCCYTELDIRVSKGPLVNTQGFVAF